MKPPAKFLPVFLLILLVFTIALMIAVRTIDRRVPLPSGDRAIPANLLEENAQRPLDDTQFSQKGYIVPLESNAKGSIYSDRTQIRGIVASWQEDKVRVTVGEETKDVALPGAVYLYCAPKYFTDNTGKQVPASTVWMNFKDPERLGTITPSTNVSKIIPKGADIAILANVGEEDKFTAYFVAGYGCTQRK